MTKLQLVFWWALAVAIIQCSPLQPPHPSYHSIPSILNLDLERLENREFIRGLYGQKYSYEPLPECAIEIAHISIQEVILSNATLRRSYQPNDIVLNIVASCNNPSSAYDRQCMISQLVDGNTIKLDRLRGKLEGCPKGSKVLDMHENIARRLGAKYSVLDDMSEYELYRGEEDVRYPILIRSTLFNALFSLETRGLSSYYTKFGYIYNHSKDQELSLNETIKFIRHFPMDALVSELDLRKFRGRFVKGILNKYKTRVEIQDLHSLFTYLHQSHEYQHQSDCRKLVEYVLSDTNKLGGVMQFDGHESRFIHSIEMVNSIRPMRKEID